MVTTIPKIIILFRIKIISLTSFIITHYGNNYLSLVSVTL